MLGRRLWPQRKSRRPRMREYLTAEVVLVIPLDFRHREKALDKVAVIRLLRVTCSNLVFPNVSTLELAGAEHRREPTTHVA